MEYIQLSEISMNYGPNHEMASVFKSGKDFDYIVLLDNGWVEVAVEGSPQVLPPGIVNWGIPFESHGLGWESTSGGQSD